jgi:serine/threonine protein kinase
VLLMGICSTAPNLAIVTEYLARGSLYRLLHHTEVGLATSPLARPSAVIACPSRCWVSWLVLSRHRCWPLHEQTPLDERRRVKMGIDMAKGMAYLHSANPPIVHRDLKSPNLLVDETFTVKICDFGLARFKQDTFVQTINGCAGTPNYMAPEVLRNEKFNEKCDVFSMGVVLWELITRKEPYAKMAPLQVIAAVVFQGQRLPQPQHCDPVLVDLIDRCWAPNAADRPSFFAVQEILQQVMAGLLTD